MRLHRLPIDIPWLCEIIHDCEEQALPLIMIHYDRVIGQMTHRSWLLSARASLCCSWKNDSGTDTAAVLKKKSGLSKKERRAVEEKSKKEQEKKRRKKNPTETDYTAPRTLR